MRGFPAGARVWKWGREQVSSLCACATGRAERRRGCVPRGQGTVDFPTETLVRFSSAGAPRLCGCRRHRVPTLSRLSPQRGTSASCSASPSTSSVLLVALLPELLLPLVKEWLYLLRDCFPPLRPPRAEACQVCLRLLVEAESKPRPALGGRHLAASPCCPGWGRFRQRLRRPP